MASLRLLLLLFFLVSVSVSVCVEAAFHHNESPLFVHPLSEQLLSELPSESYEFIASPRIIALQGQPEHNPSVEFRGLGKLFVAHLQLSPLLHPNYQEIVMEGDSVVSKRFRNHSFEDQDLDQDQGSSAIHYWGQLFDDSRSKVALSHWKDVGWVGVIMTTADENNTVYYIQPVSNTDHNHVLYRVDRLQRRGRCGLDHRHNHKPRDLFDQKPRTLLFPPAAPPPAPAHPKSQSPSLQGATRKVVEVLVVNDAKQLQLWRNSVQATQMHSLSLMNQVSLVYFNASSFDPPMQVVVVGMVTFTGRDPYTVRRYSQDEIVSESLLQLFQTWRYTATQAGNVPPADSGQLLSGFDFDEGTIGLSQLASICLDATSDSINQVTQVTGWFDAMTVAHELGHTLNMEHDGTGNSCNDTQFIMAAYALDSYIPNEFSSCSAAELHQLFVERPAQASCLNNPPSSVFGPPVCGNGLVEASEQCDCGALNCELVGDPCCDGTTCTFRPHATCSADFPCCTSDCHLVPSSQNLVCRPAVSSCDVAETCDGISAACPFPDIFLPNGVDCSSPLFYNNHTHSTPGLCYQGTCASLSAQCDAFGAIFTDYAPLVACSGRGDVPCGDLLCGLSGDPSECSNVPASDGSSNVPEQDGVACGQAKQCVGGQCVLSSSLNNPNSTTTYVWEAGDFESCSATACGVDGVQSRPVVCKDSRTGFVVSDFRCDPASRPSTEQSCRGLDCNYVWRFGPWSVCSLSCYVDNSQSGGTQVRTVECVQDSGSYAVVDSSFCLNSSQPAPPSIQSCTSSVECGPYIWVAGSFSICSVSCGGGVQTRNFSCTSPSGVVVPAAYCADSTNGSWPGPSTQVCNTDVCATTSFSYVWSTGVWSPCSTSASCGSGEGVQTRLVQCVRVSDSVVVNVSLCLSGDGGRVQPQPMPPSSQSCRYVPDPADPKCRTYWWHTSEFSNCTAVECGTKGVRYRTVFCLDDRNTLVEESLCVNQSSSNSNNNPKPPAVMECATDPCKDSEDRTAVQPFYVGVGVGVGLVVLLSAVVICFCWCRARKKGYTRALDDDVQLSSSSTGEVVRVDDGGDDDGDAIVIVGGGAGSDGGANTT